MKATVTLSLEIGKSLDPVVVIGKFEEFLSDSFHDSAYYAPDELPAARRMDNTIQITEIKSTLSDETPTQDPQSP